MVSRVQAKFVEQGFRERGPNARCADEDACAVLGESFPPQAAHRLHMVGKGGGGGSMTSTDRNGIIEDFLCCGLQAVAPYCARGGIRVVSTSDWTAGQHAYNRYHYRGQVPASSSITTRDLVLRSPYIHHGPRRRAPHLAGRRGVL